MAESIISAMAANKVPKADPNFFKSDKKLTKLDVVVNSQNNNGNTANKQNSLQKIANFKPVELKNFSARIEKSLARRKQVTQVRKALLNLTKEKVQSIKKDNPLKKNNPIEAQVGKKINVST